MTSVPRVCPRCGATDAYRARYTTGGGWRVSHYVCEACGHRRERRADADPE